MAIPPIWPLPILLGWWWDAAGQLPPASVSGRLCRVWQTHWEAIALSFVLPLDESHRSKTLAYPTKTGGSRSHIQVLQVRSLGPHGRASLFLVCPGLFLDPHSWLRATLPLLTSPPAI